VTEKYKSTIHDTLETAWYLGGSCSVQTKLHKGNYLHFG